jgi:hypothetical protein
MDFNINYLVNAESSKIIVELGTGDGRLLEELAKNDDSESLYIGIEKDEKKCEYAKLHISHKNVRIISGAFEDILPRFPNNSLDRVIAVLPSPDFIDYDRYQIWKSFYSIVGLKLKGSGSFQLITEITHHLLQPVTDIEYEKWVNGLLMIFQSIGFEIISKEEGAPSEYSTTCLDYFRSDPKRIRIATLIFRVIKKQLDHKEGLVF